MKSSKEIKFFIFFIITMLIVLLPNDAYSMQKNEKIPKEVIIGGELLHLELNTNKIIIFGVSKDSLLKNYDLVESVSGDIVRKMFNQENVKIRSKQDLIQLLITMKEKDKIKLNLLRNDNLITVNLDKYQINPTNLIDKIPYTATLTYINPNDYKFKSVGHNIDFYNNKTILNNKGEIYDSNIVSINKSAKKYVGNINGNKIPKSKGNIFKIDEYGISGKVNFKSDLKEKKTYKVADEKDIKEGPAYVIMKHNQNEKNKRYKIKITKVNKNDNGNIESFNFKIIDKKLLKKYGGIVQGMSGSPIVQNKKIIGALSHVITTDTTNGVGVYIKVMMKG
ncbi:SpoIVB peptidase precursor [uncultured Clostridium sp.]|nr:SpoIVB peptidase precursor [uncultured Clostridium sp.]SCJ03699.1 SpoIVB peptidase precursor [uncultured Clostridium sp.]